MEQKTKEQILKESFPVGVYETYSEKEYKWFLSAMDEWHYQESLKIEQRAGELEAGVVGIINTHSLPDEALLICEQLLTNNERK